MNELNSNAISCQLKIGVRAIRIYALTGGVGVGKSEAAARFAFHGIPVINADAIGHELIAPGGQVEKTVLKEFGPTMLSNNEIDRTKLGNIVFSNPAALHRLNQIVHPILKQEIARRCAELEEQDFPLCIVDAAIISDDGKRDALFDGLILVTCPVNMQIERLVKTRGWTREHAQNRINSQVSPDIKIPLADWIIDNSGSLEALNIQVDRIASAIIQPKSEK